MIKITKESIKEHLISKGWKKSEYSETDIYVSPDERYELHYNNDFSNLTDENGFGWAMLIYKSTNKSLSYCEHHSMIGCCDIEYMEQINALIDIYKNY